MWEDFVFLTAYNMQKIIIWTHKLVINATKIVNLALDHKTTNVWNVLLKRCKTQPAFRRIPNTVLIAAHRTHTKMIRIFVERVTRTAKLVKGLKVIIVLNVLMA